MRLVADIGGTNTRLAFASEGMLRDETITKFCNDDYDSVESVLKHYLSERPETKPVELVIAMAGAVYNHAGKLTNRDWFVDARELTEIFGVEKACVLNDLQAFGYTVPQLKKDQLAEVYKSPYQADNDQGLVVGIGTGFNVCPILPVGDTVCCPQVEVGHTGLSMTIANILEKQGLDPKFFPTTESLFSGNGFSHYCSKSLKNQNVGGKQVISHFGHVGTATDIVQNYAELIGWLLRDMTLAHMPLEGIYCTGGIARHVLARAAPHCCAILTNDYDTIALATPSVSFINDDHAALYACAVLNEFAS